MQLNPSQKQAVEHVSGPALVLAGAGAGKTRVLTQRVAHLIERHQLVPSRLLVVTFTNKAAKEMKERLAKLLGWEQTREIWAGTFHSICCRILRQDIEKLQLGYTRKFAIYDPKDQEKTMDTVVRQLKFDPKDFKAAQLLNRVSKFKNTGISLDSEALLHGLDRGEALIFQRYQQTLLENNALDFDDLLFLTLQLLKQDQDSCLRLQARFQQILVDEYQDTNTVQFELIRILGEHYRNIFVVGDVDQSIYSFRHANFRIILRFQEDYPDARIIKLEENYRSTGRILAAANDLIQHNQERYDKVLKHTRGMGQPLQFYLAENENDEAHFVIQKIRRLYESENMSFGDFAILYRTNVQSRIFEQKLIQYGIPYHVVGGFRFYDRKEIKDLLCYLNVVQNPLDSISLKRVINAPKRGIGPKAIEKIETNATSVSYQGRGLSLWEALQNEFVMGDASTKVQDAVAEFVSDMKRWMGSALPVSERLEKIYRESGYRQELLDEGDLKKREDRMANVDALIQAAIEYEEQSEDKTDLGGFLEKIALFSDTDQLKQEGKAVTLMTVHSSKGLEYPVVFIPAAEENIFPHIRSIMEAENGAIEEERRLMYVAITRAQNLLFFSAAAHRKNQRASINNKLSRFLIELYEHQHIEISGSALAENYRRTQAERVNKMGRKGFADLPGAKTAVPSSSKPLSSPTLASPMRVAPLKTPATPGPKLGGVSLRAGDRVRHSQWGEGEVKKVIPPLAKIRFPQGEKTVNFTTAALEKIS